ncbi:zinc-dependent alcohol dehydrogenase [Moorella sulfitireducens]|uniref:zinc-dependent alcohol dehydrogenase n=1 Tax=Neomoorella sulfitireducens TaxID=2972948 RepID=UPI0021ABF4D7|nr:alcohol dehydrogenase catalytic domain-containing protein [Moorella sulfitireducens]
MEHQIPEKMKALVLFGPNDVRLVEKPVPKPGPGEVLVRVASCGICGTDVKIITKGMPKMPPYGEFTFGHEWAGTVVALGETVDEFKVGDRVAIEAHKGCGRCENCIDGKYTACLNYGRLDKGHRAAGMTVDGGFAEYAVQHVNSVYKIPDNISFNEATYVTTAGCALYAIDKSGGYIAGDTVLVIGPGPIGLSVVQGARALGAEKIILMGTREDRLAKGRQLGATHTINIREVDDPVAEVMALTGGKGAERVFECGGNSQAFEYGIKSTKKGGVMVLVSFYKEPVTANLDYVVMNQISLLTVRGEGNQNCKRALSLMAQGKIDAKPIMTHAFPLEEFHKGLDYFVNRKDGAMKVVINP